MQIFTKSPIFFITFSLLVTIFFASCEKVDPDHRDKFVGDYIVEEYSFTRARMSGFESEILMDARNDDEIIIRNFYGVGIDVRAVVMGSKIFIPDQEVSYFEITEGQGSLSPDNIILLEYTITVRMPNSVPVTDFLEATYMPRF